MPAAVLMLVLMVLMVQVVLVPFEVVEEAVLSDGVLRPHSHGLHYLVEGQLVMSTDGAEVIPGVRRTEGEGLNH